MTQPLITRLMLVTMIVIAVIGAVDAMVGESWDLAVVLGALVVLAVVLLIRTFGRRPVVAVRADLVRWMAGRAATTGERTEDVADRAIAAYRAGLVVEDPDAGSSR